MIKDIMADCKKATFWQHTHSFGDTQLVFRDLGDHCRISLGGTNTPQELIRRGFSLKTSKTEDGNVYSGWYNECQKIFPKVFELTKENKKIVFAGYSFGGAVANLLARRFAKNGYNVELYTFGCPNIGDEEWAKARTFVHYRFVHDKDFLTCVPWWMQNDANPIKIKGGNPFLGHLSYLWYDFREKINVYTYGKN